MKEKILKIVVILGLFYTSNVLAMTEEEYQEIVSSYKLINSNNIDKYTTLNSTYIRTYEEYKNLLKSNKLNDSTTSSGIIKFFKINGEIIRLRITPSIETNEIITNIRYPKGSSTSIDDYENIDIYDQRLYAVACFSKNKEIVISSIIRSSSKDKKVIFKELIGVYAGYHEGQGYYVSNFFDLELVKDNLSLKIDKSYEENRDFPYFNEEKILNKLYKDGHCDKEDTKEANIEVFLADGKWVPQEESWNIKYLENKE